MPSSSLVSSIMVNSELRGMVIATVSFPSASSPLCSSRGICVYGVYTTDTYQTTSSNESTSSSRAKPNLVSMICIPHCMESIDVQVENSEKACLFIYYC